MPVTMPPIRAQRIAGSSERQAQGELIATMNT